MWSNHEQDSREDLVQIVPTSDRAEVTNTFFFSFANLKCTHHNLAIQEFQYRQYVQRNQIHTVTFCTVLI